MPNILGQYDESPFFVFVGTGQISELHELIVGQTGEKHYLAEKFIGLAMLQ